MSALSAASLQGTKVNVVYYCDVLKDGLLSAYKIFLSRRTGHLTLN